MTDKSDISNKNAEEVRSGGGRRRKNRHPRRPEQKNQQVTTGEKKEQVSAENNSDTAINNRNRNARPRRRPQAGQEVRQNEGNNTERSSGASQSDNQINRNRRSGRRNFRNYKDRRNSSQSEENAVNVKPENGFGALVSELSDKGYVESSNSEERQGTSSEELFEKAAVWAWRPRSEESFSDDEDESEISVSESCECNADVEKEKAETEEIQNLSPAPEEMVDNNTEESDEGLIYGLSLRNRRGFFSCRDTREFAEGSRLIVKTSRGRELAFLRHVGLKSELKADGDLCIQKIIRQINDEDEKNEQKNREKEQKAYGIAERKINLLKLKMRIVETEYLFDGSRIIFYFVSPQKVDFRELVKILATEFRTRIELRQINPREYVGMKGAIAPCGQVCCCSRFLSRVLPVDINMAENQRLGKNPAKLNGVCGRLKCCLRYENSFYTEAYAAVPPRNSCLVCANGKKATVCGSSVFHDFVTVRWEDGGSANLSFAEVKAARLADADSSKKD